jgi:hypothetical protein
MQDPQDIGVTPNLDRLLAPQDAYVAVQYLNLGLGEEAPTRTVASHAVDMMYTRHVPEGISLVLGHEVSIEDIQNDPTLSRIANVAYRDPNEAMGGLLIKLAGGRHYAGETPTINTP